MQTSLAEQILDTALDVHGQRGFCINSASLADKLMHLLDKGIAISKADKREVLIMFLRQYANPLPAQQDAIPLQILGTAIKQSGRCCL